MRTLRMAVFAICILLFALNAGCSKTYYFNFATEQDLENDEGTWVVNGTSGFQDSGVNLQAADITCPLKFNGDFTMTFTFWMKADETHKYNIGLSLGNASIQETAVDHVHMEVYGIGGSDEGYEFWDHTIGEINSEFCDEVVELPGLVRDGPNTYVVKKVGDHFYISCEGEPIVDFDLIYYNSEWFAPIIYAESRDPQNWEYGFTLQSVRVQYDGEAVPMD